MKRLLGALAGLTLGIFCSVSCWAATVVTYGDGSNSLDTTTGLLWLDLSLSANRSYLDVSANFSAGGDFASYRYATAYEVIDLWQHADVTGPGVGTPLACSPSPGNSLCFAEATPITSNASLVALLGGDTWTPNYGRGGVIGLSSTPMALMYDGGGNAIQSYYTPQMDLIFGPTGPPTYSLAYSMALQGLRDYIADPSYASWLVSTTRVEPVPIPAAFPLFAAGLSAMGFIGWRKTRKSVAL